MFRILCIFALWIGWFGHQPIRGKSIAPSIFLMMDFNKCIDKIMGKRLSLTEFVSRSKAVHGDKYDYSLLNQNNYNGVNGKIPIICPIHGVFFQKAQHHIEGHGCKICGSSKPHFGNRKIGKHGEITDIDISTSKDEETNVFYSKWISMWERCNNIKFPSYIDVSICEEWKRFSNFLIWCKDPSNNYHKSYHLDKDILSQGSKVYSPSTCCFVPQEINKLLVVKQDNNYGVLAKGGKFVARVYVGGKCILSKECDTKEQAIKEYKDIKNNYIHEMALDYYKKGKITKRIFDSLLKYKFD